MNSFTLFTQKTASLLLFALVIGTSSLLQGCVAATVGGAIVGLLPASYDYVDKNSPSSTQSIKLEEAEEVVLVTLRDLGFSIDEVRKNMVREGKFHNALASKEVLAHPSQRERESVRVSVTLIRVTSKVTKLVVTAKDSSLAYDGATARAILDEVLINVEREKGYVDLDSYRINKERSKQTEKEIAETKEKYGVTEVSNREKIKKKQEAVSLPQAVMPPSRNEQPVEVPVEIASPLAHSSAEGKRELIQKEEPTAKPTQKPLPSAKTKRVPWTIKIGTFSNRKNVEHLVRLWEQRGEHPFSASLQVNKRTYYRVFLNRFESREAAESFAQLMQSKQLLNSDAHPYRAPFAIQLGSCYTPYECDQAKIALYEKGVHSTIYLYSTVQKGEAINLLLLGGFGNKTESGQLLKQLKKKGIDASSFQP